VQGLAASLPYDRQDPRSPANRRISLIVMNREAEERFFRDALTAPAPEMPAEAPAAAEAGSSPQPPVR
jgi:chemotaxis protein MotB